MNIRQHAAREFVRCTSKQTEVGERARGLLDLVVTIFLLGVLVVVFLIGGLGILHLNIRQDRIDQKNGYREVATVCWQNPCPTRRIPLN